jgi:hypothetical protein
MKLKQHHHQQHKAGTTSSTTQGWNNIINNMLAANSHFSTILISYLHHCFANLNFRRNSQIKRHFYFLRYLHTYLRSCFHDCKHENLVFEVALKSSLNYRYHSFLYAHCVYILLIIIQLTRPLDLYSRDILSLIIQFHFMSDQVYDTLVIWIYMFFDRLTWHIENTFVLWKNPWYKTLHTTHVSYNQTLGAILIYCFGFKNYGITIVCTND